MVLDPGTVYADTITAMAVFTGVAVALLLYLVSQQTASLWYIARVYSLAVVIAFGLAIVSFSETTYEFFPGMVLIAYIALLIAVDVIIVII